MEERNAIHFDFIVNCTGLASRHLAADMQLIPAFGQVLRCEYPADPSARAAISTWVRDSTGPNKVSYIYPRTHDIVLGGTYEEARFVVRCPTSHKSHSTAL
jgi:D-amino-acid oxidase